MTDNQQEPGIAIAELRVRMYMADDGKIYHKTSINIPEGEEPPALYVLMGAMNLAEDSIKAAYGGDMYLDPQTFAHMFGECDDPDNCGDPDCGFDEDGYDEGDD